MGLAGARGTKSDDVFPAVDIIATGQFQNQGFVEGRYGLEVKAIQAFHGRELGGFDPAFNHAPFPLDQFQLRQA